METKKHVQNILDRLEILKQEYFTNKRHMLAKLDEIAAQVIPNFDWRHKISYWWECKHSPLGYCVYDTEEDPACDECIYCRDPEERK